MIIAPYNNRAGSFLPGLGWLAPPKSIRAREPTWLDDADAIRSKLSDGLRGNFAEDCDVERNLVVENAHAAADGGALVPGGSENKAEAWCGVQDV